MKRNYFQEHVMIKQDEITLNKVIQEEKKILGLGGDGKALKQVVHSSL